MTASELRCRIASREISAEEVVGSALERLEALEGRLGAFLEVFAEEALTAARAIDRRLARGEDAGPLAGLPVAIKDNLCVEGHPTTCASRILEGFVPPYEATAVARLRREGAVILGKTNLDEFAMGSSTEHSAFGPTRNPWDLERVPGGSSGGSAAAVAAGVVPLALGSDTGGSIRQPAAFCGVTGLKPTYGRVSRYGLVAFASSLDCVGPIARDVEGCALLLRAMAGYDPRDATSVDREVPDYLAALRGGVEGLRLGVLAPRLAGEMETSFREAVEVFRDLGAAVFEVELPRLEYALPAYYIVASAEASSNLARYDGVRYGYRDREADEVTAMFCRTRRDGFGSEVKRRVMLGTYALSSGYYDAYYLHAQKVRTLLRRDFDAAFESADLLLSPATPAPPFRLGEKVDDPVAMYLSDLYTVAQSLAGLPALVVPARPVQGLPVGLQVTGRPWDEARVLRAGHAFQQTTDYHRAEPPL